MELLETLLKGGANPNLPEGFSDGTILYDWALMDYVYETGTLPRMISGKQVDESNPPSPEDMADEDSSLSYLDLYAHNAGLRRPDHLILLRMYGARTAEELSALSQNREHES